MYMYVCSALEVLKVSLLLLNMSESVCGVTEAVVIQPNKVCLILKVTLSMQTISEACRR